MKPSTKFTDVKDADEDMMEAGYSPQYPMSEETQNTHSQTHCNSSSTSLKMSSMSGGSHDGDINHNNKGCETETIKHRSWLGRAVVKVRVTIQKLFAPMNWTAFGISISLFGLLVAAGLALTYTYKNAILDENEQVALDMAKETGAWFSNALDQALSPVYSLANFVTQVEPLRELPGRIGNLGHNGSLPLVGDGSLPFRNISGVCDDPTLVSRFNDIAAAIKSNANLPKVLVMLALVPDSVVCLIHPLVNTEDFPPGVALNNTGLIGLDMFAHQKLRPSIEYAISGTKVVMVGPQTVSACKPPDTCDPLVEKAFFARFPVVVPDYSIDIGGQAYKRWGLAVVKLNWSELVKQSQMYERFASKGYQFQLTREDDPILNAETGELEPQVAVLAESNDYQRLVTAKDQTSISSTILTKVNKEWTMTVLYCNTSHTTWTKWVLPLIIVVSCAIAILVYQILEQKQISQNLKGQALVHQSKIETERNMTAYFAHELRNPLGAIDSALLAMPDGLPDEAIELIDGMQLCSKFMTSIMSNLMDVRRMEEGKLELHNSPFDLRDALETVHKMFQPSAKPGVDFTYTTTTTTTVTTSNENPPATTFVLGDVHRFEQVLTNIVSNAIKYTHNGSIQLSVGWTMKTTTSKTGKEGGKDGSSKNSSSTKNKKKQPLWYVEFVCADTGPGIPKADQGQLFKRFVKRGGAPGSGLGLAISKHIVDLMGGRIDVESDPLSKPGTTFRVCVPLKPYHCHQEEELEEEEEDPQDQHQNDDGGLMVTKPSLPPQQPSQPVVVPSKQDEVVPEMSSTSSSSSTPSTPVTTTATAAATGGLFAALNDSGSPTAPALAATPATTTPTGLFQVKPTTTTSPGATTTTAVVAASTSTTTTSTTTGAAAAAAAATPRKKPSGPEPIQEELHFLICDDLKMNRMMLKRRFLKGIAPNSTITEASTGEEALSLCERETFDVIIMDQYMEEAGGAMLGTDTVIALKRTGVSSLIIGCSGNDMEQAFEDAGANYVWKKPVPSNAVIIDQLRKALPERAHKKDD